MGSSPALSWSKSVRMYDGSFRQTLIASFWIFCSLWRFSCGAAINEILPYSMTGWMYVLYNFMAVFLSTPARETALKTFIRLVARECKSAMCLLKFSFSSNSTPRNRALFTGLIVSLKRAIFRFSGSRSGSLEKKMRFDLDALSLTRHLRHQPSSKSTLFWIFCCCWFLP